MAKQLTYQRQLLKATCRTAFMLVVAVVLWSGALSASSLSTAEASILLPENGLRGSGALNAEQLIAELEKQETASSGASSTASHNTPSEPSSEAGLPIPQQENRARQLAALGSHTGGSTSGTSSSSGNGGSSVPPIDSVAPASLTDDSELIAWVSGERRCSLPMPPGNELLRPPCALIA